jgi:hypothetical protein
VNAAARLIAALILTPFMLLDVPLSRDPTEDLGRWPLVIAHLLWLSAAAVAVMLLAQCRAAQ